MNVRKRLRKLAERRYGERCGWTGGILHFADTKVPVPDVPHVPKPGKEALGMAGGRPAPTTTETGLDAFMEREYRQRRRGRVRRARS